MLPIWAEVFLVAASVALASYALRSQRLVRSLSRQLEVRERAVHFLGESPDAEVILRHAHDAARRILPLSRFGLYRVDAAGRVHEVWRLPGSGGQNDPVRDASHPDVGREVDPARVLEFTATETERSFAPRDLLAGTPAREVRLPLYSGDRFVAFLDLASPEPIDDARKTELRALIAPLTASLHAARNWAIAVSDELSALSSRRYFETRLAEEWAAVRAIRELVGGGLLRPGLLQEGQRLARARRGRPRDPSVRRAHPRGNPVIGRGVPLRG